MVSIDSKTSFVLISSVIIWEHPLLYSLCVCLCLSDIHVHCVHLFCVCTFVCIYIYTCTLDMYLSLLFFLSVPFSSPFSILYFSVCLYVLFIHLYYLFLFFSFTFFTPPPPLFPSLSSPLSLL